LTNQQQITPLPNPMDMVMESGQAVRGFSGKLKSLTFGKARENSNSTPFLFEHLDTKFLDTVFPMQDGIQYVVECPWNQERGTPRWEALCEGAKATLGLGEEDRLVVGTLVGKILEWKWTGGHPTRVQNEAGTWVAGTMDAWIIVGIDSSRHPDFPLKEEVPVAGGSNGETMVLGGVAEESAFEGVEETAYEYALALSYGNSNAQWQKLALDHPVIKADRVFWDTLVATGAEIFSDEDRVKYENDVFVKVEELPW